MERNFTNENFERFLRQNADGLRMRPSDKVWSGISKNRNRRKRRFGFFLLTTIMLTSGLGYYYSEPHTRITTSATAEKVSGNAPVSKEIRNTVSHSKTGLITPTKNLASSLSPLAFSGNGPASDDLPYGITVGFEEKEPAAAVIKSTEPFQAQVVDSYSEDFPGTSSAPQQIKRTSYPDLMTIESVINSFKGRQKKFGLQLHFTPTISYRHLSDGYIDNVTTHKPYFGFQLGMTSKYAVSNKAKLLAGLQFSVNRYGIKTWNSSTELATYNLHSDHGSESVHTVTNYNNFSGYRTDWLQNFYFQVSAPVGVELKLRGDEKMQFGVATTLQPTYVIGDRAYLISSDYKNYAEMPRLIRRWNVNTSLETFVAYSTGHLKWQVGPQVRYQLLSSFDKAYPVKENLFDFGLKVGISLNKQ